MNAEKHRFEYHCRVANAKQRATDLLAQESGLSRQKVKQLMNGGAVWLTRGARADRVRRASKRLEPGDELHMYYDPKILEKQPPAALLIADEGQYSVWNKPYGMLSHGSKWGDHCAINRWVEGHLQPQRPAFVVHRLDRAATGLMLIAHGKKVASALSALFQRRQIEKRYRVVVEGCFPDLALPLRLDGLIEGRDAVTQILRAEYDSGRQQTKLQVRIETGRKHQIRRHLAEFGYPVVGDRLYGFGGTNGQNRNAENLQLCCNHLAFRCPLTGADKVFDLKEATE